MAAVFTDREILRKVKVRKQDSSKGDFGTLLMLCGSENMPGAACLCALGALRSGLGLLMMTGSEKTLSRISSSLYEPVYTPLSGPVTRKYDAFVCGCGIGREYDSVLGNILLKNKVPCVLDADCINFLSQHKNILADMECETVITPHPGEMARLTGRSIEEIQKNRTETAREFSKEFGCITLLKGKNTVIADKDGNVFINTSGSSALAKGGSGDVLSGVIGSLLAQGYKPVDAARIGAYVHGLAAERVAEKYGEHGTIPSDLPKEIGLILSEASQINAEKD